MEKLRFYSRKILLTGGAGFIGSDTARKLIKDKNNFVVIVDNLSTGHVDKLPEKSENFRFIKCDVNNYRDMLEVMLAYRFDFVFHYAAVVGVTRTQNNPIKVLNDVKGIENILFISKNIGVKRIFYASSSEVYGNSMKIPQNAYTTALNSSLPYAIVKNFGEAYLKSYHKEYGIEYTIFRFFNIYGPMQTEDFVINRFLKMASQNKDITIYGDGNQTRTFCYIDDNVDACVKIAYEDLYVNDVINIGHSVEIRIKELAEIIIELTGSSSKLVYLPPLAEGDMQRRCPDNTRMKKVLNREFINLKDGIRKILNQNLFELEH